MRWVKSNLPVWVILVTITVYLFNNFATFGYVNSKHSQVMGILLEIKTDIRDIRNKLWDIKDDVVE